MLFNMKYSLIAVALAVEAVTAFPFVANIPGVDSSLLFNRPKRQQSGGGNPGGPLTCPNNPNHVDAPGITDQVGNFHTRLNVPRTDSRIVSI